MCLRTRTRFDPARNYHIAHVQKNPEFITTAMTCVSLEDLPIEILTRCFAYLATSAGQPYEIAPARHIQALRLTSKRCNEASSIFLVDFVRVYIRDNSLTRLEEIATHVALSKSVRQVELNLCYYSASYAKDFNFFAKCRSADLYSFAECTERSGRDFEIAERAFQRSTAWQEIGDHSYEEYVKGPKKDLLLEKAHHEYRRRFEDQEKVKTDGTHLRRLRKSLTSFARLRHITVSDHEHRQDQITPSRMPNDQDEGNMSADDDGLMCICLGALSWKGSFFHIDTSPPPVEVLADFFDTLLEAQLFPIECQICISAPCDLAVLSLSDEKLAHVSTVLHRAKRLSFNVRGWARHDSLVVDNSRPYSEIIHLGRLTSAFFKTESLESMSLSFDTYPVLDEVPQITLSEIISISRPWPSLQEVRFRYLPLTQHDLTKLVDLQREIMVRLDMEGMYLLDGFWATSLEICCNFEKLEHFLCQHPRSRSHGSGLPRRDYPEHLVSRYVLSRGSGVNPLQPKAVI